MRWTSALLAAASGVTLSVAAACIGDPGFACADDAQCLARADGRCEADMWCSYPDDACDSGRRYGPHAPSDVADVCVEPDGAGTGGDDGGIPVTQCGNGVVDDDETCDDGNRVSGDACPAHCATPGDVLWTARWDGPDHDDDRAFAIAIDDATETFYVAGISVQPDVGEQILLQRWRVVDGEVMWTTTIGRDGDDKGEQVALDASGNPYVAGRIVDPTTDGDAWVGRFTADGDEVWTATHDEQGLDDTAQGVTVLPSGELVVVGWITLDRGGGALDEDAWIQRYTPDGAPSGAAIVRGGEGVGDHALDTTTIGDDALVTGRLTNAGGEFDVWTARYRTDGTLAWEDLATADPVGNEARGVGLGVGPGEVSAVGGVLSNDIFVQLYDATGVPGVRLVEAGSGGMHDEAADVAFLPDGRFVVVGFVDFATVGFATADFWIRMHAPDGTPEWTDIVDGAGEEVDKALAVEITADETAIVVGYETVPGQSRDVWARRYAL